MFIKAIRAHCMITCQRELCHGCPFERHSERKRQIRSVPLPPCHPGDENLFFRDEIWSDLTKYGTEPMVAAWMAGKGREYFITAESARKTFGLDVLLEGVERGDIQVRWAQIKWFDGNSGDLIDEYSGPWVPFSGFIVYRLAPAARLQR